MKEWQAILAAWENRDARQVALATVVAVEGSSFRRPGARMLIFSDGKTVGSVSGGCLERDVRQLAQKVIHSKTPLVVRYDGREEDEGFAAAMGCGGVVQVLIEPVPQAKASLFDFVDTCFHQRSLGATATIVRTQGDVNAPLGLYAALAAQVPNPLWFEWGRGSHLREIVFTQLRTVLRQSGTELKTHLLAHGSVDVFYERLDVPLRLIVCGEGPGVPPLLRIAQELGWETVAITRQQPVWDVETSIGKVHDLPYLVDAHTAAVVMTHSLKRDTELLPLLVPLPLCYLGVLGPARRTTLLLEQLKLEVPAHLYAPIGLDIGAETPEQVALAVVAEIQAVIRGFPSGFLRDRHGAIHRKPEPELQRSSESD
jgi:xanthine dehydrogenase accessory factor